MRTWPSVEPTLLGTEGDGDPELLLMKWGSRVGGGAEMPREGEALLQALLDTSVLQPQ